MARRWLPADCDEGGGKLMPLQIQSPPGEMVDGFEVKIGTERVAVSFGRKVPITRAVKMIRDWLSAIDGDKP